MVAGPSPPTVDTLPPELASREQWICWRNECRDCGAVHDPDVKTCPDCDENTTKRPIDPGTGGLASTTDAATWADLDVAVEHHEESDTHGVGFVFTDDDPIVGIDIDDALDENGEWEDWAIDIVTHLNSFAEVSPSGTGIHVYVFGQLPDGRNRKDGVEMYESERYFTVTGDELPQSYGSIGYRQKEIEAVHEANVAEHAGWSGGEIKDADVDLGGVDVTEEQETYENDLGETLDEHRDRDDELDAALRELEPEYDIADNSPSGYDLSVVAKLWKRRFSAEQIAKILYQYRYRPKLDEHDTYIERTIAAGAGGERFDPRGLGEVEILDDRSRYDSIEDADLPTEKHFVLDKPPREGGSHASIDHLSEQPIVVVASRHAICEHHLDILEKVMPDGKSAVHYAGSNRACRNSSGNCPKVRGEDDYMERLEVEQEAKQAAHEHRVVTADDCPDHYCPHQFLRLATKYCYGVVTVPNLLPEINEERGLEGNNVLIDEEQALSYFRPPSVTLAEIEHQYEPDGTRNIVASSSNITDQLDTLQEIREQIHERWEEAAEANESGTFQKTQREKDVLAAIEYLEDVAETLSISDIAEEMDGASVGDVVGELRDRLAEIDAPTPGLSPANFREKIRDYVEQYYFDDTAAPGAMLECALFGYDEKHFDFKYTGSSYKLRMIGGRDVFHADILWDTSQIGVIAGPEGELFFNDLDMDAETILIEEFRYSDDFVVVPVGKEADGDRIEPVADQRARARRVSKRLNGRAHPHIAIAGTKGRAQSHHAWLDTGPADIISSPNSPAKDSYATWSVGGSAIIYANSAVSRGVDVPFFDISVVTSSGFATPYWEARKKHYYNEDASEYERARAIEHQLKAHELTNAVLRPAPTRHIDEHTGTKFIVCADWDVTRLRYLDQTTPRFPTATSAANFLENLTVGGALRENIDDVYRMVDESEGAFIQAAMEAPFREVDQSRPGYDLDELESWTENRYFHKEGTTDDIELAIPPDGEVETKYIYNLFAGWSEGRILATLKVLDRMDIVDSDKRSDKEHGGQYWVWSK